ncbi:NAD(P)-dependent oxidoreductase [Ectopseudomonas mendocina]|uniref:NAD(P)-dependent oxidoreductase n=1 Tax=Ectopseudomonas mendocina TaxID=300 RepID=A0ABZ2RED3_ECTME
MKIALIGATGFVGSAVLQEALNRGHQVTGLVRNTDKLPEHPALTALASDVYDTAALANQLAEHDAVVHAFSPGMSTADVRQKFVEGTQSIIDATKKAQLQRLFIVGGAGSLYVAPNVQLLDTPDFPAAYREGAEGARQALNMIQQEHNLAWTLISPPALLTPGERTGNFRLGGDHLLMNGEQPASITVADLAVAIVDELERPHHLRQRFTAGY